MVTKNIVGVDQYIKIFPNDVQEKLNMLRKEILTKAPTVQESIAYGMPAYKYNGKPLVYFAAYKKYIGIYATPITHKAFSKELAMYKQGKGSVQFQHTETFPIVLIRRMLEYKLVDINKTGSKNNFYATNKNL